MGEGRAAGLLDDVGHVWEWTSSHFVGYPGFRAHPYREYSEVFFGDAYRVLRGGSWATHPRVATPTFRNWDLPQRRQIFAGLRLARDRGVRRDVTVRSYLGAGDETSLADDVFDGLTRPFKELPPKYFYDQAGAALFDRICELPEYYPTRAERAILAERAVEIAALTGAAEVVELGSGTAAKSRAPAVGAARTPARCAATCRST